MTTASNRQASCPSSTTVYLIDADNCLRSADAAWDEFAAANGGRRVAWANVAGSDLLEHITDDTLRHLTARLIDKVRQEGRPVELSFNCDSPDTVRAMRMRISPAEGGAISFVNTLLEERRREPVRLIDADHLRDRDFIRVCGWCNRGVVGEEWLALEEVVERLSIFRTEQVPDVTHGLCPDCADRLEREITGHAEAKRSQPSLGGRIQGVK